MKSERWRNTTFVDLAWIGPVAVEGSVVAVEGSVLAVEGSVVAVEGSVLSEGSSCDSLTSGKFVWSIEESSMKSPWYLLYFLENVELQVSHLNLFLAYDFLPRVQQYLDSGAYWNPLKNLPSILGRMILLGQNIFSCESFYLRSLKMFCCMSRI